jgi:WD40 repeat protein/energy-coupling factor transporter ATP-binding protein EcfA2
MIGFTRSHAFFVAINRYTNGVPPLLTPVADVQSISELLAGEHAFATELLMDERATLDGIRAFLGHMSEVVGPNDRALFYFAGHGVAIDAKDGPAGYILPQDSERHSTRRFMPMTELNQYLSALPCRHLLVVLDCCFAGAFRWSSTRHLSMAAGQLSRERYEWFIKDPAWQTIASAGHDQLALDIAGDAMLGVRDAQAGHSPFATALLEGLRGAADFRDGSNPGDGVITATEMYIFLRHRLDSPSRNSRQRQTPSLWPMPKHDKGEFVFLVPGRAPTLPEAPVLNAHLNPWRGLQPYEPEHADIFFGRGNAVETLSAAVRAERLIVVTGPSGIGKSSLVRAGLLPALANSELRTRIVRPGSQPLAAITAAGVERNRDLLLVIDQAEELIALVRDPAETRACLAVIAHALAGTTIRVVVTIRSEFEEPVVQGITAATNYRPFRYHVPQMTRDELRRVIEQPAAVRVVRFESADLVDALVNEVVHMPGALPLLSFALSEMFDHYLRRGQLDRTLTQADYVSLGAGVLGSLRVRAERVFLDQVPAEQSSTRRLFERLVSIEVGQVSRRRVMLSEVESGDSTEDERIRAVLDRFVDARLLVSDTYDGRTHVELAHDALIHGWYRLSQWIREDGPLIAILRRLTPDSASWSADKNGAMGLLWVDPARLADINNLLARSTPGLSGREREFADASIGRARRNKLVRRGAIATLMIVTIVAVAAMLVARERSLLATSRALAAQAFTAVEQPNRANGFSDHGLIVASMAASIRPTIEAKRTLLHSLQTLRYLRAYLQYHEAPIVATQMAPDGLTLGTLDEQGRYAVWDLSGAPRLSLSGTIPMGDEPVAAAFDQTVTQLAVSGNTPVVTVCNLTQPAPTCKKLLLGNTRASILQYISHDLLVAGDWDGLLRIFKREQGEMRHWRDLHGHSAPIYAVTYAPHSQVLYTADATGMLMGWSLSDGAAAPWKIRAHTVVIWHLLLDEQERTLTSSDGAGNVSVRDLSHRDRNPTIIAGHTGTILDASRHSDRLAISDANGHVSLTIFRDNSVETVYLPTLGGNVWHLSFTHGGTSLVGLDEFGQVMMWPVNKPLAVSLLGKLDVPRLDFISSLSAGSSSSLVVTGDRSGHVALWDGTRLPALVSSEQLPIDRPQLASISDGFAKALITSWNAALIRTEGAGEKPRRLELSGLTQIDRVAIAADGTRIALDDWGKLYAADIGNPNPLLRQVGEWDSVITGLSVSADGKAIAGAAGDRAGAVRVWRVQADGTWSTLDVSGNAAPISSTTFLANEQVLIAGANDGSIYIWNLAASATTPRHEVKDALHNSITTLISTTDGDEFVSGDIAGATRVWGFGEGGPRLHYMLRHEAAVTALAVDSAKKLLAIADIAGRVYLHEYKTGELLGELQPDMRSDQNGGRIYASALGFDRAGDNLLGVFIDGRTVKWKTSTAAWIEMACRLADRGPSQQELALYDSWLLGHELTCPN